MVDWNGDSLPDLIVGECEGFIRVFLNRGTPGSPRLEAEGCVLLGGDTLDAGNHARPWVDDWDEDGRFDLLIGCQEGCVWVALNQGTPVAPQFAAMTRLTLASGQELLLASESAPVVTDLDGDGDQDLVCGRSDGRIYFCRNTGSSADPRLDDPLPLPMGAGFVDTDMFSRPTALDWDGDGDTDLLSGSHDGRVRLFRQVAVTPPAPALTLAPPAWPVVPAGGGTLVYGFGAANPNPAAVEFDAWTEIRPYAAPTSWRGPLWLREGLALGPGDSLARTVEQPVPGELPAGCYSLYCYLGDFAAHQIYGMELFGFTKLGAEAGGTGGECEGEASVATAPGAEAVPALEARPNPFNPVTTASYELRAASHVSLRVYDTSGREVKTLVDGWREAGHYEVTFDGSGLASGVYFSRLETAAGSATVKLLLLR
ncbi:MAG: T9SS C-terminal target domain-containing protein [Candidatus Zixiibacteriota bacterium]|nr:MAG: T9SS C-terminal target domain-containing protein [candidate division Zixibacteria bacterium]